MRRLSAFVAIFLAVTSAAGTASAGECDLVLDVSASMQGFKSDPSLGRFLDDLQSICPNGFIFGDPDPVAKRMGRGRSPDGPYLLRVSGRLSAQPFDNDTTHLADAVQTWLENAGHDSLAIVVTDNVADGDIRDTNNQQNRFSTAITAREIEQLAVIAARFAFSGKVYDLQDVSTEYSGPRAVAIYIVRKGNAPGFSGFVNDVFERVVRFTGKAQKIPIRPLIESSAPRAAFTGVSTDVKAVKATLDTSSVEPVIHISNHHLDESLTISIPMEFRSSEVWHVTALPSASLEYKSGVGDTLQPVSIGAKLLPEGVMTIGPGTSKLGTVVLPIGSVDYKASAKLGPILTQLFSNREAKGIGRLVVNMNYKTFRLSEPVVTEWDYSGPSTRLNEAASEVQGKIYRLQDVTTQLVEKSIAAGEKPVRITIISDSTLPLWPLYAFLVLLGVLAAGLAFLVFYLGQRRDYAISNESSETRKVSLAFGGTAVISSGDGAARARVRRLVLLMYVSSAQTIEMGRVLWGDGGGLIGLRRGGTFPSPLARLTRGMREWQRPRRRGDEERLAEPEAKTGETYRFRIVRLAASPAGGSRRRRKDDDTIF